MAVMIWNMIVKKQEYNPKKSDEYLEKIKAITTKQIEKMIEKYKIDINSLSGIYENS
jgi:predicted Zn-dependent peptidase